MKLRSDVRSCVCQNLRRSSRMVTQLYDEILRPSGLTISQFTLMATLDEMGETTFAPLANSLGLDPTTLSRNIDLLVRDGMVQVASAKQDRRRQLAKLTAKGEIALGKALPLWEKAQEMALKTMEQGELSEFLKMLSKVSKAGSQAEAG